MPRILKYYENEEIYGQDFVTGFVTNIEESERIIVEDFVRANQFVTKAPIVSYSGSNSGEVNIYLTGASSGAFAYFNHKLRQLENSTGSFTGLKRYFGSSGEFTFFLLPSTGYTSGSVRILDNITGNIYKIFNKQLSTIDQFYISGVTGNVAAPSSGVKLCRIVFSGTGSSYTVQDSLVTGYSPIYGASLADNGIWSSATGTTQALINSSFQAQSGQIDFISGKYNEVYSNVNNYFDRVYTNTKLKSLSAGSYVFTISSTGSPDIALTGNISGTVILLVNMISYSKYGLQSSSTSSNVYYTPKVDYGSGYTTIFPQVRSYYTGSGSNYEDENNNASLAFSDVKTISTINTITVKIDVTSDMMIQDSVMTVTLISKN